MNNLIVRALTGAVFVAVLVGGTLFSPMTFTLLFAVVTGLTTWEFSHNVNSYAGASVNKLINTVAAVYLFVAFGGFCADLVPSRAFIPYLVSIIYMLVSELYLQKADPLKNWAYAFASQIYVALAFSLLNVLAFQYDPMTNKTAFEPIYPLSVFLFLWTSDTGAYCCGSLLHKYFPAKLFERISPNKSWVGSIGGRCAVALQPHVAHLAAMAWSWCSSLCVWHLGRPGGEFVQAPARHKGQWPCAARAWRYARPFRLRVVSHSGCGALLVFGTSLLGKYNCVVL